jgi:tripartite-type tricarboxylate transporter receptor subunit TctC
MSHSRRRFLQLAAAATLPAAPTVASAQGNYPSRPVKFIVGQAAGSASDITARLIGQWFSDHLGQQFVVETRPGAAGNIATEFVTRAPADGYTILLVNSQNTINTALHEKLNFNFLTDIAPVGMIDLVPLVMVVNPSVPANTIPEFITYAKANPGKLNMASAGIGGPQHMAGELFKFMAGVDMTHVPYRGTTPAVTDMLGGQVQVMFDVTPTALPQIKAGKLRPLGVTTMERLPSLPDVPTLIEAGYPGFDYYVFYGVLVPAGTPGGIVAQLNTHIDRAIEAPDMRKALAERGVDVRAGTAQQFDDFLANERAKWAAAVKESGATVD